GGVDPGPAGPLQPVGAGAVGADQDDGHPRAGLGGGGQQRLGGRAGGGQRAPGRPGRSEPWPATSTTTRLSSATASPVPGSWFPATADAAIGGVARQPLRAAAERIEPLLRMWVTAADS